jgi:hypothetical protein
LSVWYWRCGSLKALLTPTADTAGRSARDPVEPGDDGAVVVVTLVRSRAFRQARAST